MIIMLQVQQELSLFDGQGRELGQVRIERIQSDVVFGRFTPAAAFADVESLFAEYVEAAHEQALSVVGALDDAIARLHLHLRSAGAGALPAIHDVQIGDGRISFRILPASTLSAAPANLADNLIGGLLRPDVQKEQ
jgi:hypothetical protein